MTQDEIICMAREAGAVERYFGNQLHGIAFHKKEWLERFAALVAAHVKSDQINTAYQQGCEDMKRRMEKRMQQLDSQLQLCQTAVLAEREACAKVCKDIANSQFKSGETETAGVLDHCAAAIRARSQIRGDK